MYQPTVSKLNKMIDRISQLLSQIVFKQLTTSNAKYDRSALKLKCGLLLYLQIESDKQKFVEKAKQEALKKVAEQRLREGKTPLPAGYTPQSSNAKVYICISSKATYYWPIKSKDPHPHP